MMSNITQAYSQDSNSHTEIKVPQSYTTALGTGGILTAASPYMHDDADIPE